jgi:hypothetical protein
MTSASDNFNRANGGLGSNWTDATGMSGLQVVSNACAGTVSAEQVSFWATTAGSFSADQYSEGAVRGMVSGAKYAGVVVRMSGDDGYTFYTDGASGAGHTEVARYDNAVPTVLQSFATTVAAGDVLKLQITGTTLKAYKNGVQLGTDITDATYAAGQPGIDCYDTTNVDDWSAADITDTLFAQACL